MKDHQLTFDDKRQILKDNNLDTELDIDMKNGTDSQFNGLVDILYKIKKLIQP